MRTLGEFHCAPHTEFTNERFGGRYVRPTNLLMTKMSLGSCDPNGSLQLEAGVSLGLCVDDKRCLTSGALQMSLYQLVRETLELHGGTCSRGELLSAIFADPAEAANLERSQGFARLLDNMKYSGFIELEGAIVRRTSRQVGRRHL